MALKRLLRRTTVADRVVVLLVFVSSVLLLGLTSFSPGGRQVVVRSSGRVVYVAPLSEPGEFRVAGPLGATVIKVGPEGAAVTEASCPQQICRRMGSIQASGALIACVPNKLVIRIEGEAEADGSDYDLLSR